MQLDEAIKILAAANGVDVSNPNWEDDWYRISMRRMGEKYEETGNPVLPWIAVREAARVARPIPEWAMDYLVICGERINKLTNENHRGRREAEEVGKALGFGGRGQGRTSVFQETALDDRDLRIAVHVAGEMDTGKTAENSIATVAERFSLSVDTVERAYHGKKGEPGHGAVAKSMIESFLQNRPEHE